MIHIYTTWHEAETYQRHKVSVYCEAVRLDRCILYAGVFIVSCTMLRARLCHRTKSAAGKFKEVQLINFIMIAFGVQALLSKQCPNMCWDPAPPSRKTSSDNQPFFPPLSWTLPHALCPPPFPSLWLVPSQSHDEKLPLSFRFLSASLSLRLRQCLNVNEFCISDIIHSSHLSLSLEVRDSFDHFKARSGDRLRRGFDPLSAARRFAKSIAANEDINKWKPQFKLNKLR